jgi:hypothetical protein
MKTAVNIDLHSLSATDNTECYGRLKREISDRCGFKPECLAAIFVAYGMDKHVNIVLVAI